MNDSKDWYKHRSQKNELWCLIKKLGEHWCEDENFIREYGAEVFSFWENDLTRAIECFKNLVGQCKWVSPRDFKMVAAALTSNEKNN